MMLLGRKAFALRGSQFRSLKCRRGERSLNNGCRAHKQLVNLRRLTLVLTAPSTWQLQRPLPDRAIATRALRSLPVVVRRFSFAYASPRAAR